MLVLQSSDSFISAVGIMENAKSNSHVIHKENSYDFLLLAKLLNSQSLEMIS